MNKPKIKYNKEAESFIFEALGFEDRKGILVHTEGPYQNLPVLYGKEPVKIEDIIGFQKDSIILKVNLP